MSAERRTWCTRCQEPENDAGVPECICSRLWPVPAATPHPDDFARWDARFGGFTLDAAAAHHNAKCPRYFTRADDGLAQSWAGERVWCNPPYSSLGNWLHKAWQEHRKANGIVMLLPANRCEQPWWQEWVEPYRDNRTVAGVKALTVEFLPGRLRFIKAGATEIKPNERPPFGCALLIWEPHPWQPWVKTTPCPDCARRQA